MLRRRYSATKRVGGMLAVAVGAVGYVVLKGAVYEFTTVEWTVTAAAGVIGLLALPLLPADLRSRAADGPAAGAIGLLVILEVLARPLGLAPALSTPLAAFAGGWLVTDAARRVREAARKRRTYRELFAAAGGPADSLLAAELRTYLTGIGEARRGWQQACLPVRRDLRRAVRRRDPAPSALRTYAGGLERYLEARRALSVPAPLAALDSAEREAYDVLGAEALRWAGELERGARGARKQQVRAASRRAWDASREWYYAVCALAEDADVRPPKWLTRMGREVGAQE